MLFNNINILYFIFKIAFSFSAYIEMCNIISYLIKIIALFYIIPIYIYITIFNTINVRTDVMYVMFATSNNIST